MCEIRSGATTLPNHRRPFNLARFTVCQTPFKKGQTLKICTNFKSAPLLCLSAYLLPSGWAFGQNSSPANSGPQTANSNPLADLRPLDLPQEPSSIPAPGWWILTLLMCAVIYGLVIIWRRHRASEIYQRKQLTRSAIDELNNFDVENKSVFIQQCNALLKRVAITCYPQHSPAQLSEQQWLDFLYRHCNSLDSQAFNILKHGPYLPDKDLQSSNMMPLKTSCQHWLVHHSSGDDHA